MDKMIALNNDDLKPGLYLRTNDGRLGIFVSLDNDRRSVYKYRVKLLDCSYDCYLSEDMINYFGDRLIDVIEPGDIVNGQPVDDVDDRFIFTSSTFDEDLIKPDEIRTILTQDQYNRYCTRIKPEGEM